MITLPQLMTASVTLISQADVDYSFCVMKNFKLFKFKDVHIFKPKDVHLFTEI